MAGAWASHAVYGAARDASFRSVTLLSFRMIRPLRSRTARARGFAVLNGLGHEIYLSDSGNQGDDDVI
jgi:hypothetical protein